MVNKKRHFQLRKIVPPSLIILLVLIIGIGIRLQLPIVSAISEETNGDTQQPVANVPSTDPDPIKQPIATPPVAQPPVAKSSAASSTTKVINSESTTVPNVSNNYQIQENFEGNNLDSDLWEAMTYPRGYRNNEEQSYTPSQISVNDGHLKINAKRDSAGNWLSGEVHSKWAYTYGEFETRIALSAKGAGVWPAAWMLGTGKQWPTGGEIDLFESINNELAVYGTIHGDGANGHWQLQNYLYGIDSTRYHTYKIVKDPGTISWWVDGIKRREWRQADMPNGAAWPFENNKNYVLLNLAIGGTWPGPSNDSTPSNITMMIDYFTVKNGR